MQSGTIAVTGSAGRIGSAICARARRRGLTVVGIDSATGNPSGDVDIRDQERLSVLFDGVDCVFHCAGLHAPHVGHRSDQEFHAINVAGTEAVLRAATRAGVRRLVLTSSTALLGGGSAEGQAARWIDETTEVKPRTIYHETKLAAEKMVQDATTADFTAAIVRVGRCFPETLPITLFHRLSRGISTADAANAHFHAAKACDYRCQPLIACAQTPFQREDMHVLGNDAPAVLAARCPDVLAVFRARGWPVPRRIDRVYDSSAAQRDWNWRPEDGALSVLTEFP